MIWMVGGRPEGLHVPDHGTIPEVKVFDSAGDEVSYLKEHIGALTSEGTPPESICLVARTKKLVDIYAEHLRASLEGRSMRLEGILQNSVIALASALRPCIA